MSVAIVLPARLASTRLANKLLLDRTGQTVLEHTLDVALAAKSESGGLITDIVVAADDEKLVEAAGRKITDDNGVRAMLTRADHTCGTDRIAEAAETLEAEVIVNLQADEPEMDPARLLQVATMLAQGAAYADMATLAVPIFDEAKFLKPSVVKVVIDEEGRALYFSRAPIPHVRDAADKESWKLKAPDGKLRTVYGLHHLGLYAFRRKFLLEFSTLSPTRLEQLEKLEQLRALENGRIILVGLAPDNPPGIDTPEDYEAFVKRWMTRSKREGMSAEDFHSDWLDRGATYYGH